ncbi:hypothetical protein CPB83DRAFT_862127 [Crepidotus variabilis]|uniref:Uncharacterized protein n=1 Tax=Crepidotus variabilis TaxID=179855 RepID=A0A9P6E768_9AGAR|nr:hypothetical protein CPB83DRAFT_862127 [Crepidotus variabilis]
MTSHTNSKPLKLDQDGRNKNISEQGPEVQSKRLTEPQDGANSTPNETQDGLQIDASAQKQRKMPVEMSYFIDHCLNLLQVIPTLLEFTQYTTQIVSIINQFAKYQSTETVHQLTTQIFEKAMEDSDWLELYTKLNWEMIEGISSLIKQQDEPWVVGDALFHRLVEHEFHEALENYCKQSEDLDVESQLPLVRGPRFSDLRRGMMLTEMLMRQCTTAVVSKALATEHLDPRKLESAWTLFLIARSQFDIPKAQRHLETYFLIMKSLTKNLAWRCSGESIQIQPQASSLNSIGKMSASTKVQSTQKNRVDFRSHHTDARAWKDSTQAFFETKYINDNCFAKVPQEKRGSVVQYLTLHALLREEDADTWLLAALFAYAKLNGSCTPENFEIGFSEVARWVFGEKYIARFELAVHGAGLGENERERIFKLVRR